MHFFFYFFFILEMSALTNNGTYFHQEIFVNFMYYPTFIENIGFNFIRVDSEHCIITEGISFETYLNMLNLTFEYLDPRKHLYCV